MALKLPAVLRTWHGSNSNYLYGRYGLWVSAFYDTRLPHLLEMWRDSQNSDRN